MKFIPKNSKSLGAVILIAAAFSVLPPTTSRAQVVEDPVEQEKVSREVLEPFAGAYKEVSEIHTTYEQRIVKSIDPAQADALQQEANQKMSQAVTDHGMTIEDYNALFRTIQSDPDLKKKFLTVLNRTR